MSDKPTADEVRSIQTLIDRGFPQYIEESVLNEFPKLRKALEDLEQAEHYVDMLVKEIVPQADNYPEE